jgi:antitoxin Phd
LVAAEIFDNSGDEAYNLDRLDRRCCMGRVWQVQEAKNKFSEVIDEALKKGPQIITRRGVDTVVILSSADYRRMLLQQKKLSLFFSESPLVAANLDFSRDKGDAREDVTL